MVGRGSVPTRILAFLQSRSEEWFSCSAQVIGEKWRAHEKAAARHVIATKEQGWKGGAIDAWGPATLCPANE